METAEMLKVCRFAPAQLKSPTTPGGDFAGGVPGRLFALWLWRLLRLRGVCIVAVQQVVPRRSRVECKCLNVS